MIDDDNVVFKVKNRVKSFIYPKILEVVLFEISLAIVDYDDEDGRFTLSFVSLRFKFIAVTSMGTWGSPPPPLPVQKSIILLRPRYNAITATPSAALVVSLIIYLSFSSVITNAFPLPDLKFYQVNNLGPSVMIIFSFSEVEWFNVVPLFPYELNFSNAFRPYMYNEPFMFVVFFKLVNPLTYHYENNVVYFDVVSFVEDSIVVYLKL